ncbi:MAG: hypothetical protein E7294_06620 [Lachnospiraceae bacterium]|nr:hypothetical protein [Lachnospiraceae bacterium]
MKKYGFLYNKIPVSLMLMIVLAGVSGCGKEHKKITPKPKTVIVKEEEPAEESKQQAMEEVQQPEAEPQEEPKKEEPVKERKPVPTVEHSGEEYVKAKTLHVFEGVLSQLQASYSLPFIGDVEADTDNYNMRDNQFSIADVDGDGRLELIINYTAASTAGSFGIIYGYDDQKNELKQELVFSPSGYSFLSNGILIAPAAQNSSLRLDFWPYMAYRYDAGSDTYQVVAYVSSWQKDYAPESHTGEVFPDEFDKDGDGILYGITSGEADQNNDRAAAFNLDQADYDNWYATQIGSAEEYLPDYYSLDYESFKDFTPAYLSMIMSETAKAMPDLKEDIGLATMGEENFFDTVKKLISDNYKEVTLKEGPKLEDSWIGEYDGEEIFELVNLDAGYLSYKGKQVGELTVFGVYPGMDEEDAKKMLQNFGFYEEKTEEADREEKEQEDAQTVQNGTLFITGTGFDNRAVWLEIKDQTVIGIGLNPYCAFVS